MPTLLETVQAVVTLLTANEVRSDLWLNGDETTDYTTTGGTVVPSVQKFLAETFRWQGEYTPGGTEYVLGQTFKEGYSAYRVTTSFTSTTFGADSANYELWFDLSNVVTDAEAARDAAQAAQAAAETAFDEFDDRYLGFKTSDPTLDNDGNALVDGATYWNTTSNAWFIYDLGTTTWISPAAQAAAQVALAEAARVAAEATLYDYGRTAWVDPVNGSNVTGSVGNFEKPYATVNQAYADLLVAYPSPTETTPVTVKTLGAQTITTTQMSNVDGLIVDLRDGSTLQQASGQIFVLASGGYLKILGGELLASTSYAVVNTDGKFEAVDCVIEGNAQVSTPERLVAISSTGSASQLILNRCQVTNGIWTSNVVRITDCSIIGNLKFSNDVNFEVWDTKIVGTDGCIFGSVDFACVYFTDGGADRTIRGLFRNCYFYAEGTKRYGFAHTLTATSNTVEVSLQGCQVFATTKIIYKQSTQTMRFEGNVLYGNRATSDDGVLDGLTYDGNTNRTW